jgi:AAA+ ATPase superfamily predicted ATPase
MGVLVTCTLRNRPKTDPLDLYNYRAELATLVEAVKTGARLLVIEGSRRTGKTSLLLTGLGKMMDHSSIVIDAREFASTTTITRRDLIQALERGLNRFLVERARYHTQ